MADIGFIPTRTTVQVREPDGDGGTIPAATPSSAGVCTAEQARRIDALWQWHQTHAGGGNGIIIEAQPIDTSHLLTKLEARELLSRLPKAFDTTPQITALKARIDDLSQRLNQESRAALPAPEGATQAVDQTARDVLDAIITNYEALDERVRRLESIISTLSAVAEAKAEEAARAA